MLENPHVDLEQEAHTRPGDYFSSSAVEVFA